MDFAGTKFAFSLGYLKLPIHKQGGYMDEIMTEDKLIPICSHCLRIRPGNGDPWQIESWENIDESKLAIKVEHFSHGICPDCFSEFYSEFHEGGVA